MTTDGPATIQVEVRTAAGVTVVAVGGELEFGTAASLRSTLSGLAQQAAGTVVLDLAELRFIDSIGLSLLVQAKQRFAAEGVGFELRGIAPNVGRVIETTGLSEVFALDR